MADQMRVTKNTKKPEVNKPVPSGSTILNSDVSIDVEEIENGYLITRRTEIRYKEKGAEHSDYTYETKKYYSETDPLTITTDDKALADAFEE